MAIKSESKLWDSLARFFRRHAVHRTPATARVSAFVYPDAMLDEAALRHICACVTYLCVNATALVFLLVLMRLHLFTSFSRIKTRQCHRRRSDICASREPRRRPQDLSARALACSNDGGGSVGRRMFRALYRCSRDGGGIAGSALASPSSRRRPGRLASGASRRRRLSPPRGHGDQERNAAKRRDPSCCNGRCRNAGRARNESPMLIVGAWRSLLEKLCVSKRERHVHALLTTGASADSRTDHESRVRSEDLSASRGIDETYANRRRVLKDEMR